MHRIWYHANVFLIRRTPTHDSILQVILKIPPVSIFRFADPNVAIKVHLIFTHLQTLSLKVKQISFFIRRPEGLGTTKLSASRDPVKISVSTENIIFCMLLLSGLHWKSVLAEWTPCLNITITITIFAAV